MTSLWWISTMFRRPSLWFGEESIWSCIWSFTPKHSSSEGVHRVRVSVTTFDRLGSLFPIAWIGSAPETKQGFGFEKPQTLVNSRVRSLQTGGSVRILRVIWIVPSGDGSKLGARTVPSRCCEQSRHVDTSNRSPGDPASHIP